MIDDSMIDDGTELHSDVELRVALYQLDIFERTLASLHDELKEKNPRLLAAASPAYERRIALLQTEIASYLYRNPPSVSVVTKKNNFGTARNVAPEVSRAADELVTV